jgi:hypothetical protein
LSWSEQLKEKLNGDNVNGSVIIGKKNSNTMITNHTKNRTKTTSRKQESVITNNSKNKTAKKNNASENTLSEKQRLDIKYIETLAERLRLFEKKKIPFDKMESISSFVLENLQDFITMSDQYLRTYNNPRRKIKEGGIVDRRNKRISEIKIFLEELENGYK